MIPTSGWTWNSTDLSISAGGLLSRRDFFDGLFRWCFCSTLPNQDLQCTVTRDQFQWTSHLPRTNIYLLLYILVLPIHYISIVRIFMYLHVSSHHQQLPEKCQAMLFWPWRQTQSRERPRHRGPGQCRWQSKKPLAPPKPMWKLEKKHETNHEHTNWTWKTTFKQHLHHFQLSIMKNHQIPTFHLRPAHPRVPRRSCHRAARPKPPNPLDQMHCPRHFEPGPWQPEVLMPQPLTEHFGKKSQSSWDLEGNHHILGSGIHYQFMFFKSNQIHQTVSRSEFGHPPSKRPMGSKDKAVTIRPQVPPIWGQGDMLVWHGF